MCALGERCRTGRAGRLATARNAAFAAELAKEVELTSVKIFPFTSFVSRSYFTER